MESMMTTRQIVDAIHEGLPHTPPTKEGAAVPDKKSANNDFAKLIARMSILETKHPNFPLYEGEKERLEDALQVSNTVRLLLYNLTVCVSNPFVPMVRDFIAALEKAEAKKLPLGEQYKAVKQSYWDRMPITSPERQEAIKKSHPNEPEKWQTIAFEEVTFGGIKNVAHSVCSATCATPQLFQETTGRIIKPKTWEDIDSSSLPLFLNITSSDGQVFDRGIVPSMRLPSSKPHIITPVPGYDSFDYTAFNTQSLHLNKKMELCLHPQIIEPTRQRLLALIEQGRVRISEERSGCAGRPIFPMICRRMHALMKEVIYSKAEHILSLPME